MNNDHSRRDPYHDSYMTKNSRQSKASFEFETFQGGKWEGRNISSSASKYSSTEIQSRRGDHISYVPRDSINKFQLHYLSDERQFRFIKKGKVEGELNPQVLKGFKRSPHFDLINCHSMINVDDFIPTSAMKNFSYDVFCVGSSVDKVKLNFHAQNMVICDKEFSRDTLKWFPPKERGRASNPLSF
ncbi:hypothetical protein PVK06_048314 [Gossypium arboreum]|uniref:Uncharacterized protein n=1 Tax=Gossypium arboreum TaxID=29729 RepID=A0ABR0MG43_GOSAR|nr:hypothetical protein PVK06_048314 [Gossypium arboreum]